MYTRLPVDSRQLQLVLSQPSPHQAVMHAAANAFALWVLLVLTSLRARCQHDEATDNDETDPLCKTLPNLSVHIQRRCVIYSSGPLSRSTKVSIAYGTGVELWCTGAKNLTISRNGKKINPMKRNNAIMWSIRKLDLQLSENVFTCADIETNCEQTVIILVAPGFEVISPNVEIYNKCPQIHYTVHYGNSVSVLCSGINAARLVMSKDGETLSTKPKNDTAIKSFERTPDLQISEYVCTDVDTASTSSVIIKVLPRIYFQSRNETSTPYRTYLNYDYSRGVSVQEYYFKYSGPIEIFCSGPRSINFIGQQKDGTNLLAKKINENTVSINITKLGITRYICVDSVFPDYVKGVQVKIEPRMEVVSPSVRISDVTYGERVYLVTYGHSLEIICSGPDASRLTVRDDLLDITNCVEQTLNKSTVRYTVNIPVWDETKTFVCSEKGRSAEAEVAVRVLPAVTHFRCVSYNLQFVNCSWKATNNEPINTLFYVENGILNQICEHSATTRRSKFCTWDYEDAMRYSKVLIFLMQSCCDDGCYNQTFHFDHLSVLKLAPPGELKVLRTTSRSAVLQWDEDVVHFGDKLLTAYNGDLLHKVHLYSGIEAQDVNSSPVTCRDAHCKMELNVSCPGQFYEVKIYRKLKIAVGEQFWSDPSSSFFFTDSENDNKNVDPKCNQEPIKTKEVMMYLVRELRAKMRVEIQPMKQKVRSLQSKLAEIRKYMASTKEQDIQ